MSERSVWRGGVPYDEGPRMTVRCAAVVGIDAVASLLHRVPGQPRVVVSGNHVTPSGLLGALGADLESYRLFALNAQLVTVSRIPGPV